MEVDCQRLVFVKAPAAEGQAEAFWIGTRSALDEHVEKESLITGSTKCSDSPYRGDRSEKSDSQARLECEENLLGFQLPESIRTKRREMKHVPIIGHGHNHRDNYFAFSIRRGQFRIPRIASGAPMRSWGKGVARGRNYIAWSLKVGIE